MKVIHYNRGYVSACGKSTALVYAVNQYSKVNCRVCREIITRRGILNSDPFPKPTVNWITYTDMEPKMSECPLCKSAIPSDHPALLLTALDKAVKDMGGWDTFESDDARWGKPVGSTFKVGPRSAKVEAKKVTYNAGDLAGYSDYYGSELPQGSTFSTYVVVEIDGNYFKKTGTGDSYGSVSWDGDLRIVVPTEKTVKVFE